MQLSSWNCRVRAVIKAMFHLFVSDTHTHRAYNIWFQMCVTSRHYQLGWTGIAMTAIRGRSQTHMQTMPRYTIQATEEMGKTIINWIQLSLYINYPGLKWHLLWWRIGICDCECRAERTKRNESNMPKSQDILSPNGWCTDGVHCRRWLHWVN